MLGIQWEGRAEKRSGLVSLQYLVIIFKCALIPDGVISPLFVSAGRAALEVLLLTSAVHFLPAFLVMSSESLISRKYSYGSWAVYVFQMKNCSVFEINGDVKVLIKCIFFLIIRN